MEHFDPSVTIQLQEKLQEIANIIKDDYIGNYGEGFGDPTIDEIYGVPYPGFAPWQNGGFSVKEYIRYDIDSSYHLDNQMSEDMDKSYDTMLEYIRDDLKIDTEKDFDSLSPEEQEQWQDYEQDWFEPALLGFDIWVTRDFEILSRIWINYRDAPYYRDKYARDFYETQIAPIELIAMESGHFAKQFFAQLDKVLEGKTPNKKLEATS